MKYDHLLYPFFFFSSRRRHTRLQGDWSSDVCSSDLTHCVAGLPQRRDGALHGPTRYVFRDAYVLESSLELRKIGRASCREREEDTVGVVLIKCKKIVMIC